MKVLQVLWLSQPINSVDDAVWMAAIAEDSSNPNGDISHLELLQQSSNVSTNVSGLA